jgi:Zn-dependent protease
VLVIGWLLVWGLADGQLPSDAPHYATIWYWLAAIAAVVIFWAGLLAHELAHSLVATKRGVEVAGITLWLFGGVSRLRGETSTPADELRVALAGPATSIAIGGAFGVIALSTSALGGPDLLTATTSWLAIINGLLAVFNLVPAAPLDGGRVLHAVLWRRSGDRDQATIAATNAGRGFAYVMIAAGVVLVGVGELSGIWFAFLGWFLMNAARAEATHVLVREALLGITVEDVMTRDPLTAPAHLTVARVLDEHMLVHHCSAFPLVGEQGRVVSLVTLRQVKNVFPERRAEIRAEEVAWPVDQLVRAQPDEPVTALLERLAATDAGDGRALVFDDDRLVGIVSPTDLTHALDVALLRRQPRPAPTPT